MIDGGFYEFDGNRFHLLLDRVAVGNDNVVSILPDGKEGMILLTVDHGLFSYRDGVASALHTDIDKQLNWAKGNRAVMLGDSILVVGTILDGIYGLNKDGHLLWHLSRDNQLNNNSVMGLFCDNEDNLWAALDDGISFVHTNTSVTLLTPSVKDLSIGMVYGVERVGEKYIWQPIRGLMSIISIPGKFGYFLILLDRTGMSSKLIHRFLLVMMLLRCLLENMGIYRWFREL